MVNFMNSKRLKDHGLPKRFKMACKNGGRHVHVVLNQTF